MKLERFLGITASYTMLNELLNIEPINFLLAFDFVLVVIVLGAAVFLIADKD